MSEWKELKIDNLPPDILTGDYEFMVNGMVFVTLTFKGVITDLHNGCEVKYKKLKSKAPTHEEIMTKWWLIESCSTWGKVIGYSGLGFGYSIGGNWRQKDWFIGRESSDMPPEKA